MSKLGNKAIQIPKETKIKLEGEKLIFNGPKGTSELSINEKVFSINISKENYLTILALDQNNKEVKKIWGTTRSLIDSAIIGVSAGHEKILELSGVGYRAALKGKTINMQLGFSHDTTYDIPEGINISVEKQMVKLMKIFEYFLTLASGGRGGGDEAAPPRLCPVRPRHLQPYWVQYWVQQGIWNKN